MRVRCLLFVFFLVIVSMGVSVSQMNSEDPFAGEAGEFSNSPLRSLTLTNAQHVTKMTAPLQQWADTHGYKFRVSSSTGQPESILFQLWNGTIVIIAEDRLATGGSENTGLDVFIYWNGDVADDALLDVVSQQISAVLSPFGSIKATSAPPGTPPRSKIRNRWSRP